MACTRQCDVHTNNVQITLICHIALSSQIMIHIKLYQNNQTQGKLASIHKKIITKIKMIKTNITTKQIQSN